MNQNQVHVFRLLVRNLQSSLVDLSDSFSMKFSSNKKDTIVIPYIQDIDNCIRAILSTFEEDQKQNTIHQYFLNDFPKVLDFTTKYQPIVEDDIKHLKDDFISFFEKADFAGDDISEANDKDKLVFMKENIEQITSKMAILEDPFGDLSVSPFAIDEFFLSFKTIIRFENANPQIFINRGNLYIYFFKFLKQLQLVQNYGKQFNEGDIPSDCSQTLVDANFNPKQNQISKFTMPLAKTSKGDPSRLDSFQKGDHPLGNSKHLFGLIKKNDSLPDLFLNCQGPPIVCLDDISPSLNSPDKKDFTSSTPPPKMPSNQFSELHLSPKTALKVSTPPSDIGDSTHHSSKSNRTPVERKRNPKAVNNSLSGNLSNIKLGGYNQLKAKNPPPNAEHLEKVINPTSNEPEEQNQTPREVKEVLDTFDTKKEIGDMQIEQFITKLTKNDFNGDDTLFLYAQIVENMEISKQQLLQWSQILIFRLQQKAVMLQKENQVLRENLDIVSKQKEEVVELYESQLNEITQQSDYLRNENSKLKERLLQSSKTDDESLI